MFCLVATIFLRTSKYFQIGQSDFQKPSLSKWSQVHNRSCENEFYLHENEQSFLYHLTSSYSLEYHRVT